jgi:hypothetical protein
MTKPRPRIVRVGLLRYKRDNGRPARIDRIKPLFALPQTELRRAINLDAGTQRHRGRAVVHVGEHHRSLIRERSVDGGSVVNGNLSDRLGGHLEGEFFLEREIRSRSSKEKVSE